MNRRFCKPREDMTPEFLPDALVIDGRVIYGPKEAHAIKAKYLPLSYEQPVDPPQGKHYVRKATVEPDGENGYRWQYELVDDPPAAPRRWTRLAIETALAKADMLDAMDAYLEQAIIVGKLTAARAFQQCNYVEEGYPNAEAWNALLDGAASALGKTREDVDAFLATIPTEGGV